MKTHCSAYRFRKGLYRKTKKLFNRFIMSILYQKIMNVVTYILTIRYFRKAISDRISHIKN